LKATTTIYINTLSLHDALPISLKGQTLKIKGWRFLIVFKIELCHGGKTPDCINDIVREGLLGNAIMHHLIIVGLASKRDAIFNRSEEHTSELQSRFDLVCRLLL